MGDYFKRRSVVAFIDILGFKDLIDSVGKKNDDSVIDKLTICLENAVKIINLFGNSNQTIIEKYNLTYGQLLYKQISDAVFFASDYEPNSVHYQLALLVVGLTASVFQSLLLAEGFYVRGGIAEGYCSISGNVIFSDAYIKAYELERTTAIYPRVLIHRELIEKIEALSGDCILAELPHLLVKDAMDITFINPFCLTKDINIFLQNLELISSIIDIPENVIIYDTKINMKTIEESIYNPNIILQVMTEFRDDLEKDLISKSNDANKYGKLLWLREFLNWVEYGQSLLKFQYFYPQNKSVNVAV